MVEYGPSRRICKHCHIVAVNTARRGRLSRSHVVKLFNQAKLPLAAEKMKMFINDELYAEKALGRNRFHGLMRIKQKTTLKSIEQSYDIFIINGLHPVVFNGVLAHELMHVYLKDNNYDLPLLDEEGLCELMAYFVLKASRTTIGEVSAELITTNPDSIYGDGFRKMKALYDTHQDIRKLIMTLR